MKASKAVYATVFMVWLLSGCSEPDLSGSSGPVEGGYHAEPACPDPDEVIRAAAEMLIDVAELIVETSAGQSGS